ncbi:ankyrin repeat domain-containing protein 17-like isoform X1 [Saccostrea echinata]|uniref:ankyrin repeat domain-containing protein 17-like isoform X1 n=1 Tax=Saccostrea echinata TaxID=191078 RepID=UPI002A801CCC|nr:ankyrin repeat domain-containing protein 17-like isoform X1 [Saccostrea echinata]
MQNVTSDENVSTNKNIRTVEIEQGSQTVPYPSLEKNEAIQSSQSTFGQDISDDDEVSDVGSFIMDHDIDEEDQDIEPKFLLPTEGIEASNIPSIDPETHARLEALLEAAGLSSGIGKLSTADGKALTDPEVLRKLTSSVSCALDEAAQALHRMRAEQQGQLTGAEGSRSLAEACSDGDVPTVRKLLHEGGSVHETTEEGESLLSLACSAGYYELAQVLLAMKANVEDRGIKGDCTPLMEAASGGYVDIVKLLITHDADVNAQSSAGNTPLHYAACGGFEDVVQELIEAGANVEQHNENGHTPLMESASAGHVGVARILLAAGAGINTHSNEFKESALTLACYKGHLEMVKFLLEAGADQEHKTDEMHTALMEASMDGHVEVARLLLDSGAQVNMPADSFESPLTLAACGGHVDLAALLIERGANLEEVNDEGYTPLMEAAREGHEEMVGLLLANGAYINAQTEETQETGLTLACCGGFLEVADFLIKAGANIELGCSTPLMEAAQEGHLDLVRYLLKAGANVHATTGTGDTALTYACENGHTDVAEALLEHGAELEHESEGGRTPLMKAARAGYLCTVQFLISKGADVNRATSTNDHTVLSLACAGGHLAVVELLLAHGADPAHKLKDGSTMIIEAAKGGHTQVVKLLLEYPNRVLMNSPESALVPSESNIPESRVPVQGLGNIVPPSDPNSSPAQNNITSLQTAAQNVIKKASEKDANLPLRNPDQVWKNMQKSVGKRNHNNSGGDGSSKPSKTTNIPPPPPPPAVTPQPGDSTPTPPQYGDMGNLPDESLDVKASERLEAIINNVMAKELDSTSATREEQILRKQQILHELQKVEKELQEKAQAQLFLSAQHQLEQQQQQQHLQHVLQQGAKVLQRTLEVQVKIKQEENSAEGSSSEEKVEGESPASPQPSNDLDKQVTSLLPADVAASGQIVFPNIPYDSNLLPASSSQPMSLPSPASSEASTPKESKDWPRNNGNTPKRGANGKGGNRVKTPSSSAPTTPTATSAPSNMLPGDQNKGNQSNQQVAQSSAGIQSPANNNSAVALATYRQQIQNIVLRHQQQQQLQLQQQQQNPQQQQNQSQQQTIQFPQLPQLQLTPEQQEHLLTMLSQQTFQPQITNPSMSCQQIPQQIPQQQFAQQPMIQQPLQLIQPPQPMTQQQQQQLLQQQQQAQILTQQLQQQIKPPQPAPPQTAQVQKNARTKRHLYTNQQQATGNGNMQGIETITPPPSTPLTPNPSPASPQSISPLCTPDLDSQTESNHDTALTLACHGGHSELVNLLLSKGADIEHRDKKGFTPLILAATAGHVDVVEILLESGADMEAQSERTKDTPLSLACSGGRYEVVELLLSKGANKEHRNVSDYTPLSLAASGGYVNIIKLLLSHGAEINSRTGSKLGISPLMLAAMNGHTAAVKLLLDMGSDINAQIETNRNTALTLACFQGRHEVVSLLVDRKANIEHRAKTGLTPLMEAASGGYVEVGRVLLDKGADVNAPPVPSSRDTALTIAADKGHYRFVELLLSRNAAVDVKNKKGNSPLWLACNGGHLDVVQLLVSAGADIDSQDNRKVSCLMSSFRKGHVKVSKWMVKHVNQFPSDQELSRYIATVSDKELQKKCQQCMEIIVSAKDRQAAEAFKNANILLEELDKERQHEENKKAAAAKKRERKKKKKKEKQQEKDVKDPEEEEEDTNSNSKNSTPEPENCEDDHYHPEKEEKLDLDERIPMTPPTATVVSTMGTLLPTASEPTYSKSGRNKNNNRIVETSTISSTESRKNKRNRKEKERVSDVENVPVPVTTTRTLSTTTTSNHSTGQESVNRKKKGDNSASSAFGSGIGDLDDFGTLPASLKISDREVEKLRKNVEKTKPDKSDHVLHVNKQNGENVTPSVHSLHVKSTPVIASPKKGQKKEEGWKEVVRRPVSCKSKKVQVPSSAISRVIGRGGCNINAIREVSGAHIEVEKQRGSGERVITIRGTVEGTKQAHTLISALVADPDKDLLELLPKNKNKTSTKDQSMFFIPETVLPPATTHGQTSSSSTKTSSNTRNMGPRGQNQSSSARSQTTVSSSVPSSMVWGGPPAQPPVPSPRRNQPKQTSSIQLVQTNPEKNVTRQLFPNETKNRGGFGVPLSTCSNTSVSYTLASSTSKVTTSGSPVFTIKPDISKQPLPNKPVQIRPPVPGNVKVLQRPGSHKQDPQPLPIISGQQNGPTAPTVIGPNGQFLPPNSHAGSFSPFNNLFSNVADQLLKKDDASERMNFASVAAAGVIGSLTTSSAASDLAPTKVDPQLQAKAPGFRPVRNPSPQEMEMRFKGMQMPPQMMNEIDSRMFRTGMPNQSPSMSPRSSTSTPNTNMSPRNQTNASIDPGHISSTAGQKEEYSTPSQPMTLPKIESTLNPNAPDFTSRQAGAPPNHPGGNMPPNNLAMGYLLYQQALAQQLQNLGGPGPNLLSPGMISQQEFANLIHQFVASGQAQPPAGSSPSVGVPTSGNTVPSGLGVPGQPPVPPRPFSPLTQGRPSSAPLMGGMPRDGNSPGPIGPPPPAASPLTVSPQLSDQIKTEDRRPVGPIGGERPMGPIGGERAQRRAPGPIPAPTMSTANDYSPAFWNIANELSMQWGPVSTTSSIHDNSSPAITSSEASLKNHTDFLEGRDMSDQQMDKVLNSSSMSMEYYTKGIGPGGGQFSMAQQSFIPGPVGDGIPNNNMWNPQVKGQVSEASDKVMWNSWSSQTSM